MQYPPYVPPNKQFYFDNNKMYVEGFNYDFYQHPAAPQPAPPPPPPHLPTHAGTLYFDQLTGQYFYQKSTHSLNQSKLYFDQMSGLYSNSNIYAFNDQIFDDANMDSLNDNFDNNSQESEEGFKTTSAIITEVTDDEDEVEINIKKRDKKKDYVDAISLNEDCDNLNN